MVKLKRLGLFVSMVMAALISLPLHATVVPHLYDVTLTSTSQSQDEWQNLVQQGLSQVLERISSDPTLIKNPHVKQALENAPDYVEQYSYEGNQLVIKYSPELVNQLVQKMGQVVWGQRRPKVVLWLAIEDNHQRRLVGVETDPNLQTYLNTVAQKQGIPLILPLMDLEDMSAITVTDVWGQFPSVLQQASLRYGAQTILLGRVLHNPKAQGALWEGSWQLLEGGSPTWRVEGQSLEEVLGQGISGATRFLKPQVNAQENPRFRSGNKPFLIAVEGIQSSSDFVNVESYLKSLNPVKDVNIHQLLGALAIFEITLQNDSGRHALEQAVSMDQHLIPSLSRHQEIAGIESSYRWVAIAANNTPAESLQSTKPMFDSNSLSSPLWDEETED
ncbi:MAG: DUF2066 domain-containing protein [Proteobacteria bacterium]|nr:DUF2066 domain-containing protein [Pseudomonadota bacterium]